MALDFGEQFAGQTIQIRFRIGTDQQVGADGWFIDDLSFACFIHHPLVTNHGWTTHKNPYGQCEWRPPPGIPHPGGTNDYHHPERYLDPPKPVRPQRDPQAEDKF